MISDLAIICIALISLFVSLYVVIRDNKMKKLDTLHKCRQNIMDAFYNDDTYSVYELMEFEENPDSPEAQKYDSKSREHSDQIDREFEYTCYLVIKGNIDLNDFFNLFKGWISGRSKFWRSDISKHKQNNYPYSWQVIQLCEHKGLLPLKKKKVETH